MVNVYDPEVIAIGGGVSARRPVPFGRGAQKLPELIFYKTMPYARVEARHAGQRRGADRRGHAVRFGPKNPPEKERIQKTKAMVNFST
jgi:predicted NBD/HSP70 family sugar kinase